MIKKEDNNKNNATFKMVEQPSYHSLILDRVEGAS